MEKKFIPLVLLAMSLLGCSAAHTALNKRELTVESHVSNSVVLEPLAPENRVVYVRVKDLSGNSMRKEMMRKVVSSLEAEGIVVTRNPKEANLMLNAFVVSAKKTTKEELNGILNTGYSGGAEGAAAAGVLSAVTGGSGNDNFKAALAGAAVGFLADTLVEDAYYTFVLDVELRERPIDGDVISNRKKSSKAQGYTSQNASASLGSQSSVERGENFNWIIYETRIVSTANQMNLDIQSAIPEVQKKASETLAEFLL